MPKGVYVRTLGMRMGNQNALGYRHTEEAKAKIRLAGIGRHVSEETKAKRSLIFKGRVGTFLGHHHSEETKAAMRERWQDPEHRDKTIKAQRLGRHIHPNKPELVLLDLLDSQYPGDWQYVGDGQLIIGGKNPDFWNGDHKLVEMWGNYWHKGQNPQERVGMFSLYGYKTLIIWESELAKPEVVLQKLALFTLGGMR